jgi:hypothetical protein
MLLLHCRNEEGQCGGVITRLQPRKTAAIDVVPLDCADLRHDLLQPILRGAAAEQVVVRTEAVVIDGAIETVGAQEDTGRRRKLAGFGKADAGGVAFENAVAA